jgi:N-acetylmuramoyl-L-alanine amidase
MPGALLELLFISNAADAAVLADDRGRDAIARGVAEALVGVLGLEVPA